MARFGLFMSVDLLSLPAPPDSTVGQDVGGGQGGGQPVSLPLSTPTLMHLPLQSGRVWGDPTQRQAAGCPFVSLSEQAVYGGHTIPAFFFITSIIDGYISGQAAALGPSQTGRGDAAGCLRRCLLSPTVR